MSIAPTTPRPVMASVTASTSQPWRRHGAGEKEHPPPDAAPGDGGRPRGEEPAVAAHRGEVAQPFGRRGWLGLAAHGERNRAAAERERVAGHGRVASLRKYKAGVQDRARAHRKGDTASPGGAAQVNSLPDDRIACRGRAWFGPPPWPVSHLIQDGGHGTSCALSAGVHATCVSPLTQMP